MSYIVSVSHFNHKGCPVPRLHYNYIAAVVVWWHNRAVYVAMCFNCIDVNSELVVTFAIRLLH
jgi:hypothetical protein